MLHEIYKSVDWLQFTVHEVKNWYACIPKSSWDEIGKPIRPLARYVQAFQLIPDGRIDIAEDKTQGTMITLYGDAMRAWRERGEHDDKALVGHAVTFGKVSRLDFAIDVIDKSKWGNVTTGDFRRRIEDREWKSPLKIDHTYDDQKGGGYTQYWGSKNSRTRVRIYDKAAEGHMEKLWFAWTRIELQTRKNQANVLTKNMAYNGVMPAGSKRLIETLDFPNWDVWKGLIEVAPVDMLRVKKPPSDFWGWLDKQVEPAIRKHAKDLEENKNLLIWLNRMKLIVEQVGQEQFLSGDLSHSDNGT